MGGFSRNHTHRKPGKIFYWRGFHLIITQLTFAGLSVMDKHLAVEPLSERSRNGQRNIFVVAHVMDEAPVLLKRLASEPPGSKQVLFDLPEV